MKINIKENYIQDNNGAYYFISEMTYYEKNNF